MGWIPCGCCSCGGRTPPSTPAFFNVADNQADESTAWPLSRSRCQPTDERACSLILRWMTIRPIGVGTLTATAAQESIVKLITERITGVGGDGGLSRSPPTLIRPGTGLQQEPQQAGWVWGWGECASCMGLQPFETSRILWHAAPHVHFPCFWPTCCFGLAPHIAVLRSFFNHVFVPTCNTTRK
jgi:hypothetical protein